MKNREIGKSLLIIQNHIHRNLEEMKTEKILPRSQGRILRFIYSHRDIDIYSKDIENEFHLRRSSATEILKKLESTGMIKRISSGNDKRLKKIVITKVGEESVEQISNNILEMENILHQNISDEELEVFFKIIDKMISNCVENKKGEDI